MYTLKSSTSQATSNVSGVAAQVIHFIFGIVDKSGTTSHGDPLFNIRLPYESVGPKALFEPRLTGMATQTQTDFVDFNYYNDDPVKLVRQVLCDFAKPVNGYPSHATGAGYVDRAVFNALFARDGHVTQDLHVIKTID